ncbi:MAG: hypothetical protein IPG35_13130 [Flavobacteriales bacterium]|nr:hypothetical protein [Flavobacteriales bacterium]
MKRICGIILTMLLGSFARAQGPGAFSLCAPVSRVIHLDRSSLPPVYDYQRLGIFCKLDVQLARTFPLPVRFRLGDPMLVEAWEGKGPLRHVAAMDR